MSSKNAIINSMRIDASSNKHYYSSEGWHHRLDGPAIEYTDGRKKWCLDGTWFNTFQDYLIYVKPLISDEEYIILVLTYGVSNE